MPTLDEAPTHTVRSIEDLTPAGTAVDRFSGAHADGRTGEAGLYRELIPLDKPQAGEQYGFEVDLDRCTGCKSCVAACHSLNGLDEDETWRSVGMLQGGSADAPHIQHVTTACHHCLDPACSNGCPVNAYEKEADTGIVRHLDDQCIGCQYCVLKCPYEVPKYNRARGIVRKCDMCVGRLRAGEAPACVQSCPTEAIRIVIRNTGEVRDECETGSLVPAAPDSAHTMPTTTYRTTRVLPRNLLPADFHAVRSDHSHPPLIVMLVLTQLSVGAFAVDHLLAHFGGANVAAASRNVQVLMALGLGLLALGASLLHLGRPQYAFRALIGLKTSWLSREIVAFSAFAMFASLYAASFFAGNAAWIPGWAQQLSLLQTWLGGAVLASGAAGVLCSVMIYGECQREMWRTSLTGVRFFGCAAVLGLAVTLAVLGAQLVLAPQDAARLFTTLMQPLAGSLAVAAGMKLLWELFIFRHLGSRVNTALRRSAELMARPLRNATRIRFGTGLVGGLLIPFGLAATSSWTPGAALAGALCALALVLIGELTERYLFFTAAAGPRMPGNP